MRPLARDAGGGGEVEAVQGEFWKNLASIGRGRALTLDRTITPLQHTQQADLTDATSFDAPLAGTTIVFHTASPVVMHPPKGRERELLIDPAVRGTEAVLSAATRAGTVTKIVITSSISALYSSVMECAPDHAWCENDWNTTASETYLPYHASKTAAEKRAFEMEAAQSRWTLATMLPGVVQGPPPGNVKCESVGFMRKMLNGGMWPGVPASGTGFVDVDDVAAAHALAGVVPAARGRYILVAESMTIPQYASLLKPEFAAYKLPFLSIPLAVVWFAAKVLGKVGTDYELIAANAGRVPRYDTSKVTADLGLQFMPVKQTAVDMAASLIDMGIVKRVGGGERARL